MTVGFFLEFKGSILQLPLNPEKVEVATTVDINKTDVVKLGEVAELGKKKLASIQFECFLPHSYRSMYGLPVSRGNFRSPNSVINFLDRIIESEQPARLVVTDTRINMLVGIEQFDYSHQAGNHEDVYYTIKFSEWKDYSPLRVEVNPPSKGKTSTNRRITVGSTVIVNGRLHRDSWGNGAGIVEKNAVRRINYIEPSRKYPYHITTLNGGWRGWVTKESVRLK